MFAGLDKSQLSGAIEAMLFITDEPTSAITLADMLEVDAADVEMALVDLRDQLRERESGIGLQEVAGGWRLVTREAYHELLERYVLSWETRKLTQAMLEVLAIVAYAQPVTRQGVSAIRGVNSDSSINSLVEKGLIRESGVAQTPGNPTLYATTRSFLEKFGLRSLYDLPDLEQYAPDDETRRFIASRLSSTRTQALATPVSGEPWEYRDLEADDVADHMVETMQGMLVDALTNSAALVEKIDFDELRFDD